MIWPVDCGDLKWSLTYMKNHRDHLLTKGYLNTKFEFQATSTSSGIALLTSQGVTYTCTNTRHHHRIDSFGLWQESKAENTMIIFLQLYFYYYCFRCRHLFKHAWDEPTLSWLFRDYLFNKLKCITNLIFQWHLMTKFPKVVVSPTRVKLQNVVRWHTLYTV